MIVKDKPIYLYRRRGLNEFVTCTRERYEELSTKSMFEVKILTDMIEVPASPKMEVYAWCVSPSNTLFYGNDAENEARWHARQMGRSGSKCEAFPLFREVR